MKKYFKIIALLVLTAGCKKQLDLIPENTLTEDQIISSAISSERLLVSSYFKTYSATRGFYYLSPDLSTGISLALATNSFAPLYNGTANSTLSIVQTLWNNHYDAINEANVLINLLPTATFNNTAKVQFIAEAKFVRALNYFTLLRFFGSGALTGNLSGPGLPLQLVNYKNYDPAQNIARSSCQDVYTQILKDLDEAAADLSDNAVLAQQVFRGRSQKTTCFALASRVALYMRDYTKAINYSTQALTNTTQYGLASSPALIFPVTTATTNIPFNNEIIFAFPVSYNANAADINQTAYYFKNSIWPNTVFLNTYAANDIRNSASMIVVGSPTGDATRRCPSKFANASQRDHLPILRIAEIYLNKAEALVRSTNSINTEAITLLNAVRQRSFPTGLKPPPFTVASFATASDLITAILRERRWELAFEGHDSYDKIRIGQAPNPLLTDPNKWVLPIPRREIDLTNGIITQNPGY